VFVEACSAPSQRKLLIEADHLAESSSTAHKLLKDSPMVNLLQQLPLGLSHLQDPKQIACVKSRTMFAPLCWQALSGCGCFYLGGMFVVSSLPLQVLQR